MQRFSYYSDEDIIKGIVNDNDWALNALYKIHYPMIYNLIINNNGSSQEAKDIYQETIIVLYNNIHTDGFKLECKIKTYIYSVARRLWLNELKIKNRYVNNLNDYEEVIEIEKSETDKIIEDEKRYAAMHECLEEIGEPCSNILKSFYLDKVSMNEIAELMGYTNSENAKNQKYKCLQRLKKLFFSKMKMEMKLSKIDQDGI